MARKSVASKATAAKPDAGVLAILRRVKPLRLAS
jgi:hypothetical protein